MGGQTQGRAEQSTTIIEIMVKSSKFSDEILIWQGLATAIAASVTGSTERTARLARAVRVINQGYFAIITKRPKGSFLTLDHL